MPPLRQAQGLSLSKVAESEGSREGDKMEFNPLLGLSGELRAMNLNYFDQMIKIILDSISDSAYIIVKCS